MTRVSWVPSADPLWVTIPALLKTHKHQEPSRTLSRGVAGRAILRVFPLTPLTLLCWNHHFEAESPVVPPTTNTRQNATDTKNPIPPTWSTPTWSKSTSFGILDHSFKQKMNSYFIRTYSQFTCPGIHLAFTQQQALQQALSPVAPPVAPRSQG